MPDITMCRGEGCECKLTCYRYVAEPSMHIQSYFAESPIINNGCDYYINKNRMKSYKEAVCKWKLTK